MRLRVEMWQESELVSSNDATLEPAITDIFVKCVVVGGKTTLTIEKHIDQKQPTKQETPS